MLVARWKNSTVSQGNVPSRQGTRVNCNYISLLVSLSIFHHNPGIRDPKPLQHLAHLAVELAKVEAPLLALGLEEEQGEEL